MNIVWPCVSIFLCVYYDLHSYGQLALKMEAIILSSLLEYLDYICGLDILNPKIFNALLSPLL